jgi:hypothetical protein
MADGNFSRSPLATNNYQSGVRAGKATMRTLAIKAFEAHLNEHFATATDEEKHNMLNAFKEHLN